MDGLVLTTPVDLVYLLNIQHNLTMDWLEGKLSPESTAIYEEPLDIFVSRLHIMNLMIWDLENQARKSSDSTITRTRQSANQIRNCLIQAIDELLRPESPTGEAQTETPGMILDRLSILVIKRRLRWDNALDQYFVDLVDATIQFLNDLKTGKKRYIVQPAVKIYKES